MEKNKLKNLINMIKRGSIYLFLGFFMIGSSIIVYKFSMPYLETAEDISDGGLDYKAYGNITEIISVDSGGFGSTTKCVVKINNSAEVMIGYVCNLLKEDKILYKAKTQVGDFWRVGDN